MNNYFGERQSEVTEQTVSLHVEHKRGKINNGHFYNDTHTHKNVY